MIWKLHSFEASDDNVGFDVARAKDCKTLIIDLGGNGGPVDTIKRLIGQVFEKDITIGDQKMRNESKSMIAKTRGSGGFWGGLTVLINHDSASASALFAKTVQLIGTSKGAATESKYYSLDSSFGKKPVSATVADFHYAGRLMPREGRRHTRRTGCAHRS